MEVIGMLDFVLTYPGFFLFGLTAIYMFLMGLWKSVKYRSWIPLYMYVGTVVVLALVGFVVGLVILTQSH
jgi:hypothetical protein